jgi:hypothetical protein
MISPITLAPIATSPWPVKPVAWYSASSVYNAVNSNKVTTNGTGVYYWRDLSGHGLALNLLGGLTAGAFVASGPNGKPAVDFNGVAGYQSVSGLSQAQEWNAFCVVNSTGAAFASNLIIQSGTGNIGIDQDGDNGYFLEAGLQGPDAVSPNYGSWELVHAKASGSNSQIYFNGTLAATGDAGTQGLGDTGGTFYLGCDSLGDSTFVRYIAEVVLFGALSAGQATAVTNTLKRKYGL